MSLASVTRAGRRAAEALMADTVTVSSLTGDTTLDETTGREVPETVVKFTSKCKVQARGLAARESEVGGRIATEVRYELHLPVDAAPVEVDDLCQITDVGDLSDTQLLGRTFRVVSPVAKSYATARRIDVEEVVS